MTPDPIFHESENGITFAVKVLPRASRAAFAGVEGDSVKVRLNAPPVEGRANQALVKFLAEALGVRQADVEIVRGETARHKLVRVRGVGVGKLKQALGI